MRRWVLIFFALTTLVACDRGEFGKRAQGGSLSGDPTQVPEEKFINSDDNNSDPIDGPGDLNNVAPSGDRAVMDLVPMTHRVGIAAYRAQAQSDGNVVVGAMGLTKSLSIAALGASDEGLQEIDSLLGVSVDPLVLNRSVMEFQAELETGGDRSVVKIVPSVWAQNDAEYSDSFLNDLAYFHGLDVRLVDFQSSDTARLQINNWYRGQTDGFVTEAVPPRGIASDTRIAFVDSTFFAGAWATPFDRDLTTNGEFKGVEARTIPFMQRQDYFLAHQTEAWDAVVLPYDGALALVAVQPRNQGLEELENELSDVFFQGVLDGSQPAWIELRFPKVELGGRLDSSSSMDLGFEHVANADDAFGRVGAGLGAGAFVQRTKLSFSEQETTTDGGLEDPQAPPEDSYAVLSFDRPFVFAVIDTSTNALVYLGRMVR